MPGAHDPTVPTGVKGAEEVWAYAWQEHPATEVAGFLTSSDPAESRLAGAHAAWGPAAERLLAALIAWMAANGGLALALAGRS